MIYERLEITIYYDKYIYRLDYNRKRNEWYNNVNDYRNNIPKNINKKEY